MSKYIIDSGLQSVWSRKLGVASGLFVPMTGAVNTTFLKQVRPSYWLEAATPKLLARWAYQMSDDGETWTTTPTGVGSYSATEGWTYDDAAATSVTTDQRLFVRFGMQVANDTGSTDVEQGMARLRLEVRPVEGGTLAADLAKVFTKGDTSDRAFHPLVGPVAIEDVGEHRASLRLYAPSGTSDLDLIPAYQVSNDGISWYDGAGGAVDAFTTFGTARTSIGTDYGTTFATFSPTVLKKWVRWGVAAKNAAGSTVEAAQVALRIDYRRVS